MRDFVSSSALKKDVKLAQRRNKDLTLFKQVICWLTAEQPLPQNLKDQVLIGNWNGCREVHLEPDFLFIYRITDTSVIGERLGTHSDLFFKQRR